jgi:hypothetical protein
VTLAREVQIALSDLDHLPRSLHVRVLAALPFHESSWRLSSRTARGRGGEVGSVTGITGLCDSVTQLRKLSV